jgi:hypothetical protein
MRRSFAAAMITGVVSFEEVADEYDAARAASRA